MTLYLKTVDVVEEVTRHRSALIVVCRFCPATSLALDEGEPYLEPLRRGLNTASYERHIAGLQRRLEEVGLETGVFRGNLANFIICMWGDGQRRKLKERAARYEAVVVLGCEAGFEAVRDLLAPTDCAVFPGMTCEGVLDAKPRVRWPGTVELERVRVMAMSGGT
jgi:hypothetical protein